VLQCYSVIVCLLSVCVFVCFWCCHQNPSYTIYSSTMVHIQSYVLSFPFFLLHLLPSSLSFISLFCLLLSLIPSPCFPVLPLRPSSSFVRLVYQVRVARVQTCDLSWNQIRKDGATSIGIALHKNEELEKLNLAYNALASGEQENRRTREQEIQPN